MQSVQSHHECLSGPPAFHRPELGRCDLSFFVSFFLMLGKLSLVFGVFICSKPLLPGSWLLLFQRAALHTELNLPGSWLLILQRADLHTELKQHGCLPPSHPSRELWGFAACCPVVLVVCFFLILIKFSSSFKKV